MAKHGQLSDVNFAVRLYPDGNIEFYYGDFTNLARQPWLAGLTGGSKAQSFYPAFNATGIQPGMNVRFRPPALPDGLEISPDGILSCRPAEPGRTWVFRVGVEDYQGLQAFREVSLSTSSLGSGEQVLLNPDVRFYPNPVSGKGFLDVGSNRAGPVELKVLDLAGRVLMSRSQELMSGRTLLEIDFGSDLSPGIYLVELSGTVQFRSKIFISNTL
jgi:hypothetical protein